MIITFNNINIVIGITGGIAAYKACGIISFLKQQGANVDIIMTKNACNFITPLTLETLSGNKVIVDMFDETDFTVVKHIYLAKKADLFLIIPTTANIIGKVANGIADDMLTTTLIATKAPIIFAPAMNNQMYENPIVQKNLEILKTYGYHILEPSIGHLACGYVEKGKLPKNEEIIDYVKKLIKEKK